MIFLIDWFTIDCRYGFAPIYLQFKKAQYPIFIALLIVSVLIAGFLIWTSTSSKTTTADSEIGTASSTETKITSNFSDIVPKPAKIAVTSELERIKLAHSLDSALLENWLEIIGVDSTALRFKELGTNKWYSPSVVNIIFKDISPLSFDERWQLYIPIARSRDEKPVAGLATHVDATKPDTLEYWLYYDPATLPEGNLSDIVNRKVFEVFYEGLVGSKAISEQDYSNKFGQAFPEDTASPNVIDVSEDKSTSSIVPQFVQMLGRHSYELLDDVVYAVKHFQIVSGAYAQSCVGNWKCGSLWNQCLCSNSGANCTIDGALCSSASGGVCNCNTICVQETGGLNSCVVAFGQCQPAGGDGNCSQCLALNTCGWSGGPAPTPRSTPVATPPGGFGDRCVVAGKVERYDNLNLVSYANAVNLWSSITDDDDGTNTSGNFSFDKTYANVGPTIQVKVNPLPGYRTFNVKGSVPAGCSVIGGGTTISCPKSSCLNKNVNNLVFNFEEIPPKHRRASSLTGRRRPDKNPVLHHQPMPALDQLL